VSDQKKQTIRRVESGPIRFGSDWAGYFIRGDDAMYWVSILEGLLTRDDLDIHHQIRLKGMIESLRSCAEPCEAARFKSADDAIVDVEVEIERRQEERKRLCDEFGIPTELFPELSGSD
jgi:hypothetical protein